MKYHQLSCLEMICFIEQSLSAFSYLQSIKVAHCDIKPQNILISDLNQFTIKVCDIGSAKHLSQSSQQSSLTGVTGVIAESVFRRYPSCRRRC